MKKLLWTSAVALTAAACMTACDDSGSGASNSIPSYKTEAALPDTCEMEIAKVDTAYFACFENKWIEVTDSATIEQLKEGLDEEEIKAKLEELQSLLPKPADNTPKPTSSSAQGEVEGSDNEGDSSSSSEEEESSSSSKKKKDKDKDDSGSGSGEGGSGSGEETVKKCGDETYDPKTQICGEGNKVLSKCGESGYDPEFQDCNGSDKIVLKEGVTEVTTKWLNQTMLANGDYGFLYDSRDHQLYRTVKIGTQTWMAQNLNYTTTKSKCAYTTGGCNEYGSLYLWTDALKLSDACNSEIAPCEETHEGVQGVCPDGWHVPTETETQTMIDENAGPSLISTEMEESQIAGGSGYTNSTGLSLIPVGRYGTSNYEATNTQLNSILSTERVRITSKTYYVPALLFANTNATNGNGGIQVYGSTSFKSYYMSLRCLKN